MNEITSHPLTWPEGWKRTRTPNLSRFDKTRSISQSIKFVLNQLSIMGVPSWNVIISSNLQLRQDGLPYSNQRQPDDKGVSVWWKKKGKQQVIALDKYNKIEDNLYAIGKTLEAMRGIERWGSGEILERTFTGFTALPPPTRGWRDVLQVTDDCLLHDAENAYKAMRKNAHPDHGGSIETFHEIQKAIEQARTELG